MLQDCPLCASSHLHSVFSADVPLNISIPRDTSAGLIQFHALRLSRCRNCGHIFNSAYDQGHEDTLYGEQPLTNVVVDPAMTTRFDELLNWLGDSRINGRQVIEIGGGGGYMARRLSQYVSTVTLFEPSRTLQPDMVPEANITLINGYWPKDVSPQSADLIVCRQVLEHVADPVNMMRSIRGALSDNGAAYLEVPDGEYVLDHGAFPDIHVQHVQYFSRQAFIAAAASVGLKAERTLDIKDGHDFGVLLTASKTAPFHPTPPDSNIDLKTRILVRITHAESLLADLPQPLVLYGANAHTQSFINALPNLPYIAYVLDDNPANAARAHYTKSTFIDIRLPQPALIAQSGAIVITAYMHDLLIAQKLRKASFDGPILSIRPAPVPDNNWGLKWLYAGIETN